MSKPPVSVDLKHFKDHGFQMVEDVLSVSDLATLKNYMHERMDYALEKINLDVHRNGIPKTVQDIARLCEDKNYFNSLSKEEKNVLTGHFDLETRLSENVRSIVLNDAFQDIVKQILDSGKIFLHMPPMARYVLPHNKVAAVPAHRDAAYNDHMAHFVTAWIPLTEINERCGGVLFFKGSDKNRDYDKNENRELWYKAMSVDGYQSVKFHMKPGDVVFFNPWTIHESLPNTSDVIRFSLDMRFFGEGVTSQKPYYDFSKKTVIYPVA